MWTQIYGPHIPLDATVYPCRNITSFVIFFQPKQRQVSDREENVTC